jgi:hypothetical protein
MRFADSGLWERPRRPRNTQSSSSTAQRDEEGPEAQTSSPATTIPITQDGNAPSQYNDRVHYDSRMSVMQLIRSSGRQRLSSLDDGPTNLQNDSAKGSLDPDEVLPDDSSLTYIGTRSFLEWKHLF